MIPADIYIYIELDVDPVTDWSHISFHVFCISPISFEDFT